MGSIFVITLCDAIGLSVVGIVIIVSAGVYLNEAIRHTLCKHDGGVNETMACDAICKKCGKNMGFIGDWRDKQKAKAMEG